MRLEATSRLSILSWLTLPRPTINSTALYLQPTHMAVWTVGELHISLISLEMALTTLFRFDYFLSEFLSPDDLLAPTRLAQATLYEHWKGYAPPGSCTLVPLDSSVCENNSHGCAFIALCPTMRIPEDVVWNREIVYNCVWSLLIALEQHNRVVELSGDGTSIRRILMTGLATGVGNVSPQRCAQQMALAVRDFIDASQNAGKWRCMEWNDAVDYAHDCRRTHQL